MNKFPDHIKTVVNLPKKLMEWLDEKANGEKSRNQLIKDLLLEKMKDEDK